MHPNTQPQVVVIGLCGHGLALVRAIARHGFRVHALEQNRNLPGNATNCTSIEYIDDINGDGLVEHLVSSRPAPSDQDKRPTLLLTNDRMVATVGRHIARITPHYRVSWSNSAPDVLRLLKKDEIEAQCRRTGIRYPRTATVTELSRLHAAIKGLSFPIIFKPTQPISAFKTIVVESSSAIDSNSEMLGRCLPVIAQEFIAGDDRCIHFGALLLEHGKVICHFEGRKLRSRPMGHTTIAIPEADDEVHQLAVRFFAGLEMNGPVSLELKKDSNGSFWVIEPTVGRTDFWIDVAVHNGANIPLMEHLYQTGITVDQPRQTRKTLWLNGERDSMGLIWLLLNEPGKLFGLKIRGLYLDFKDPRPFMILVWRRLAGTPSRVFRKVFG